MLLAASGTQALTVNQSDMTSSSDTNLVDTLVVDVTVDAVTRRVVRHRQVGRGACHETVVTVLFLQSLSVGWLIHGRLRDRDAERARGFRVARCRGRGGGRGNSVLTVLVVKESVGVTLRQLRVHVTL